MLRYLFTQHPASVGETYAEHFRAASGFGGLMILAGLACLLHALVPALFTTTGSEIIKRLHQRMVTNRRRHPLPDGFNLDFVI